MPVAEGSDLTGIDLLSDDRFDVVLALLWPGSNGPEAVLDELLPGWRRRSPSSEFDTYVAHDGQVSIRLAKGGDTADNP
ncbi:MAG: hypothetical protein LBS27_04280 [Bifidobacteriaceae bacterium]|nr:hypothetical protein [Bifidobacteriaceae bacterium]